MADGCQRKLVNDVSEVSQGSVLCLLLFLYIGAYFHSGESADRFSDDSTLIDVVSNDVTFCC